MFVITLCNSVGSRSQKKIYLTLSRLVHVSVAIQHELSAVEQFLEVIHRGICTKHKQKKMCKDTKVGHLGIVNIIDS